MGKFTESATAPRLWIVGGVHSSPHSRLRRQYGVMQVVTALRLISLIINSLHLHNTRAHNRASGCNFNNPLLTASVAKSATWGKPMNPRGINRGAVADPAARENSRPVQTPVSGASVVRGLRCAHPRLSPFGFRLRGHAFQAT